MPRSGRSRRCAAAKASRQPSCTACGAHSATSSGRWPIERRRSPAASRRSPRARRPRSRPRSSTQQRAELERRKQLLDEREQAVATEDGRLREERERLAHRDQRVRVGQQELGQALADIEAREGEVNRKEASLEADIEVRLLEVERREDTLGALEERIDARKRELATLVTRAQADLQRN